MAQVENNLAEGRYELTSHGVGDGTGGDTAIAAYRIEGGTIVFTHTAVPEALEGHGFGSKLIAGALDDARTQGLRVVPQCEFVAAFIERHPEYQMLVTG